VGLSLRVFKYNFELISQLPMNATYPVHTVLLDLTTLIILGEEKVKYEPWYNVIFSGFKLEMLVLLASSPKIFVDFTVLILM
jgi:hypothetical protein